MQKFRWGCLYDTDDDNLADLASIAAESGPEQCAARAWSSAGHELQNVYGYFGNPDVWPRGFPLDSINNTGNRGARAYRFEPFA